MEIADVLVFGHCEPRFTVGRVMYAAPNWWDCGSNIGR